ncbi:glycosyltransferase family A protein [Marinobacter sp. W-8]|uniref:glycosyltransferase family A protein n=1 Tax=Marinobacter sp. W-8 TaxID=3369658 RepID=UPI0037CA2C9C
MIIANMATFPARSEVLPDSLARILPQVDKINLCLNSYEKIPEYLCQPKINAFIPDQDYRDVGKFVVNDFSDDDYILYMDDDLVYPEDYVSVLINEHEKYQGFSPIIGVHGIIYPDVYDGQVGCRVVFSFRQALKCSRVVNQLGTGTILCKGYQAAKLNYMLGSERFVDVRYSRYAYENGWPLICISRSFSWLDEVKYDETIFSTFTSKWPLEVIKECQYFSGYGKLSTDVSLLVEGF